MNGTCAHACTILVVDDNPGLIPLINKYLHREGFHSVVVHTGTEAIAWLTHNHADFMLWDLQLSDMNEDKLVKTLEQQNRSLPFIVVTGHGDERPATKMMKFGVQDYVVKDETLCALLPSMEREPLIFTEKPRLLSKRGRPSFQT